MILATINDAKPVRLLTRTFAWIHGICLVAVIAQPTTPSILFGRYSRVSVVLLSLLLLTWPLACFAPRFLTPLFARLAAFSDGKRWLLWIVGWLSCFVLWVIPIGNANSQTAIRLYLTFIVATIMLSVSPKENAENSSQGWLRWIGPILTCFGGIMGGLLVPYFPRLLWVDEGFDTAIATAFATTHHLTPSMYFGGIPSGPQYSMAYAALGVWYQIFGTSISNGRLFIWVLNLLVLLCLYQLIRLSYGQQPAWTVVILTGFAMLVGNTLRASDAAVSLYLTIAFCAAAYAHKSGKRWPHLIVGFAAGFSLDGHPNAYRFLPTFFLAYLVEYLLDAHTKRQIFFDRRLLYLLIGGMLGIASYIGFYGLLEPEGFFGQVHSAGLFSYWQLAPTMIWSNIEVAIRNAPILFGLAATGIYIALRRHSALDRLVRLVSLFSILIFAFSNPTGIFRDYYLFHAWPLLGMLAAGALVLLLPSYQLAWGVLTVLLVASSGGWLVAELRGADGQSYSQALAVANQIRLVVPRDSRFVGVDPFYLNMSDYPNFIEMNAGEVAGSYRHVEPLTIWQQLAPDVIAIVPGYPETPPNSLMTYIQQNRFQKVHCWNVTKIGEVDLYFRIVPASLTSNTTCETLS